MNKRRTLQWGAKCLSVITAFALTLGTTSFAANTGKTTVNEQDIPIEVGDLITSEALGVGTIQVTGANVRVNPTKDAEVVTVLEEGTQFAVISKDGDWYRISVNGITGFVSSEYVSVQDQGELELGYGVLQDEAVNIHASADDTSEVLATLTGEDVVEIIGIIDGWYEINFGDIKGYVHSDSINPTVYIAADRIFTYAVVNCAAINLRSTPEAEADKVDTLYSGSLCTLLEENEDWYKVQYGDMVGYVLSAYMNPTNDSTAGSTEIETANEAEAREAAELKAAQEAEKKAEAEKAAQQGSNAVQKDAVGSAENSFAEPANSAHAVSQPADQNTVPEPVVAEEPAEDYSDYDYSDEVYEEAFYDDYEDDYYEDSYDQFYDDYEEDYYEESYDEPSYDYSAGSYIVSVAENYLGVPYVWGGTSPSGFDCSGFTQYVFNECGYELNRIAASQYYNGTYVSYDNMEPGDLVFFCNTYSASGITHVGIYIGDGEFIHCAGGCVKISSLSESYYSSRYYAAVRVV